MADEAQITGLKFNISAGSRQKAADALKGTIQDLTDLKKVAEKKTKVNVDDSAIKQVTKSTQNAGAGFKAFTSKLLTAGIITGQAFKSTLTAADILTKPEQIVTLGMKDITKKIISGARESFEGVSKYFNRFKRLFAYRIFRNLMSQVFTGLKEGMNNLYKYQDLTGNGGGLVKNLDRMTTSMLTFRNSVGAATEPILNVLIPLLTQAANAAAELFNGMAKGMAVLTGQKYYNQAIAYNKRYLESLNKTQGKLASIDDLHIIGNGQGDPTAMFTTQKTPDIADKFGFGKNTARKVNERIKAIRKAIEGNTPAIVKKAQELADALNGFNTGFNGLSAGRTAAVGITSIARIYNSFMNRFNFGKVGVKTGDFLNGLFTFDAAEVGKAFSQKWNAIIDYLHGVIKETNWAYIGKQIGDSVMAWFGNIEWDTAGRNVGEGITGLFDTLGGFVGQLNPEELTTDITTFINNAIDGMNWETVGQVLGNTFGTIIGGLADIIDGVHWDELVSGLDTALSGIDWVDNFTKFTAAMAKALCEVIKAAMQSDVFKSAIAGVGAGAIIGGIIGGLPGAAIGSKIGGAVGLGAGLAVNSSTGTETRRKINRSFSAPNVSFSAYANGGYPDNGDLFWANESGPELVGQIGGRTAVANNAEIIEGIKAGVLQAMLEANAAGGKNNGEIHVTVDLDGRTIGETAVNYINSETQRTSGSPLYSY